MKYKLIKPVNENYSAIEQILTNRNIKHEDINSYLNTDRLCTGIEFFIAASGVSVKTEMNYT